MPVSFCLTKRDPLRAIAEFGLLLLLMLSFLGASPVAHGQGCTVSVDGSSSGIGFESCREGKEKSDQGNALYYLMKIKLSKADDLA